MLIHLIAAARPNFMKIAPVYHQLITQKWADPVIVHTGQHYDLNMSDVFFQDLGLPIPHIHLGVGSGSHAEQTGKVIIEYESVIIKQRPDLVIVAGDVNSTMAATLASVKLGIKVAHLEAGLRSHDRSMPEEINRMVTDVLADILWTPSFDADENLLREGVSTEKIFRVGNIMIDSLEMLRNKIEAEAVYKEYDLDSKSFGLVTLHRPSNVDDPKSLRILCDKITQISKILPLIFPVHPRTKKSLENSGLSEALRKENKLYLCEPLSYIRFMNLLFNCRLAITDSGGIQEETTYLDIPCLTLRSNTERPITIWQGTNQLCAISEIEEKATNIIKGAIRNCKRPEMWDGKTAARVVDSIKYCFSIP
jgi:UDP-N-acetylglucosamine 2-epimerase (non-hydrolysing)